VIDDESFRAWLDDYGRAWEAQDPEASAALYREDALYFETPFDEPMRGVAAIRDYSAEAAAAQKDVKFGADVLAVSGDTGIARWRASFTRVPSGMRVELDGVFLVTFDDAGRCREFREWWHRRESEPES
jgi:uncharacterized protein (TIGR02246 family)